jgi:hypothetical protein
MVLFGLERSTETCVRPVCGDPNKFADPGCSSRGDRLTPAQPAIKVILNEFRRQVTAREKSRGRFGVRFQLKPALFFAVSY